MICGLELGDSKKTIPSVQIKNAGQSEKDHLSYVQKIDSLTKYDILYSLENDTISEIEVLISCQSHDLGDRILNDFKNYYREKYTAPMMDKGYLVFNCFDGRKRNFKISLTDNSSGETSLINLLFYREK